MAQTSEPLVIAYVLEGVSQGRGYQFVTPTDHLGEEVVRHIWRHAMPRGNGWSGYVGAAALKGFPVPGGRWALSRVTVTDEADEHGRRGIRRAEITLHPARLYPEQLRHAYETLSASVQDDARFELAQWRRLNRLAKLPRHASRQLLLTHPYSTPADWRLMEAIILRLAYDPPAHLLAQAGRPLAFTTLALSPADEAPLVGVPSQKADDLPASQHARLLIR